MNGPVIAMTNVRKAGAPSARCQLPLWIALIGKYQKSITIVIPIRMIAVSFQDRSSLYGLMYVPPLLS